VLERLGIDGSLLQSFAFQDKTGYSGKHHKTGVKMSVIVEVQEYQLQWLLPEETLLILP